MALRLIREAETVERTIGGTTFTVQLCPHGAYKRLRAKHSARGRVDQEALSGELLATHVVGWRDLADAEGADLPYAPSLVAEVLLALPEVVTMDLLAAILEPATKASEALGESTPS